MKKYFTHLKIIALFVVLAGIFHSFRVNALWEDGHGSANEYTVDDQTFINTMISGHLIKVKNLVSGLQITNSDSKNPCYISGVSTGTNQFHSSDGATGKKVAPGETVVIDLPIYQSANSPIERINFSYRHWVNDSLFESDKINKLKKQKTDFINQRNSEAKDILNKIRTQKKLMEILDKLYRESQSQVARDAYRAVYKDHQVEINNLEIAYIDRMYKSFGQSIRETSSELSGNTETFNLKIQLYAGENPGPLVFTQKFNNTKDGYILEHSYKNKEYSGSYKITIPYKDIMYASVTDSFDSITDYSSSSSDNFVSIGAKEDHYFLSTGSNMPVKKALVYCKSKEEAEKLKTKIRSLIK